MRFKISKCQEIIQKYQDFFDDLQCSYSLPEGWISEIEELQEKYLELFTDNLINTQNFWVDPNPEEIEEEKVQERVATVESYDEPLPIKDPNLSTNHIKHKHKIPVLDLSKVQNLTDSEEEEEDEDEESPPNSDEKNSISSDGDLEDFITILNQPPEDEYRIDTDEAKHLEDEEGTSKAKSGTNYELEQNIDVIEEWNVQPVYTSSQEDVSKGNDSQLNT